MIELRWKMLEEPQLQHYSPHKDQLGSGCAGAVMRNKRWLTLTSRTADMRGLSEPRCPKRALPCRTTAPLRNLFLAFIDGQLHDFLVS
jgi:hypothetical protein